MAHFDSFLTHGKKSQVMETMSEMLGMKILLTKNNLEEITPEEPKIDSDVGFPWNKPRKSGKWNQMMVTVVSLLSAICNCALLGVGVGVGGYIPKCGQTHT